MAQTKPRPAYCSSPKELYSIHGVAEGRVFCSVVTQHVAANTQRTSSQALRFCIVVRLKRNAAWLSIAPLLPELHSWLKFKPA